MKIPDKIYVSEELLKEHNWNQVQCKDTEYIRNGAILGWLDDMIEDYSKRGGTASMIAALTFKLVRTKIETL